MKYRLDEVIREGVYYDYFGRELRASPGEGYAVAHRRSRTASCEWRSATRGSTAMRASWARWVRLNRPLAGCSSAHCERRAVREVRRRQPDKGAVPSRC
jgi:hypothetical protein